MNEIVGEIIDLLRNKGIKINSPYDFENWIEDNCSHSQLFRTGKFAEEIAKDTERFKKYTEKQI